MSKLPVVPPARKYDRLALLDGLRGVAAIAVVLHHEPAYFGSRGNFPRAYLAVDFFFMLSGFVLTLAYEPRLRSGLKSADFMRQRMVRLWPVLAVGIVMGGSGALAANPSVRPLVLLGLSLLLVPVLKGYGAIYQLDGPQWSVSFELIANYVHALWLYRLSNRALIAFAGVCALILAWQGWIWGGLASGDVVNNWWGGFARVGFSYTIGVWFGRKYQVGRGQWLVGRCWGLAALPVPVILMTAPLWPLSNFAGDCLAVFLLLPSALWIAANVSAPPIAQPMLGWLGRLSYPIYAIHVPVVMLTAAKIHGLPDTAQSLARGLALLLVVVLAQLIAISPVGTGHWRRRSVATRAEETLQSR